MSFVLIIFFEINFILNRSADLSEILYTKNTKNMLSNETNPKGFDWLEQKLWFSKDLNISA